MLMNIVHVDWICLWILGFLRLASFAYMMVAVMVHVLTILLCLGLLEDLGHEFLDVIHL
jgi:hypothetical protein